MNKLSALIRLDREFDSVLTALGEQLHAPEPLPLLVSGLSVGAEEAFLLEMLREARRLTGSCVLLLVASEERRERWIRLLRDTELTACALPERHLIFHSLSASHDTERERLSVLRAVADGRCDVLVSTPVAAMLYTMPEERLTAASVDLRVGDTVDIDELSERLVRLGFRRTDTVEGAGQFARRGGILDVCPDEEHDPVRLEFFGDEIDRMGCFDRRSQRMTAPTDALTILPAREVVPDRDAEERLVRQIRAALKKATEPVVLTRLQSELDALEHRLPLSFLDKYVAEVYPERPTALSYLERRGRTVIFVEGTADCRASLEKTAALYADAHREMVGTGALRATAPALFPSSDTLDAALSHHLALHVNPFAGSVGTGREGGLFGFRSRRTVAYGDNPSLLLEDLGGFRSGGYRTLLVSETVEGAASLADTLQREGISFVPSYKSTRIDYSSLQNGGVYLLVGDVDEGFDLIGARVAVLSMKRDKGRAVMAERRQRRILKRVGGAGERLMSHADLSVGDYVVHRNYGIGRFEGIETVRMDGQTRDYITLQYAGTDRLLVPCDRLEMIGKYIGARDEGGHVKLSRMGGGDWQNAKARAGRAVKDMARELIELYARRQRTRGFAFAADTEMERAFDAAFEFEETAAQLSAIEEIKRDMMRPVPMNRLLCGDVGFGKTEVALRAAFKAIVSGKQVAILVPTTILALQHFQTATSRMRAYPVNVEMLSRFRTPKEQAAILRRTARGEIDLLIGTHKLLSKQLAFRDLGLLIVDEEQRFGVAQKERLKTLAVGVDVLTLTATPIPRTLNMAMSGISDISLLDEAPSDRRPVQTYVLEHDEGVVYEAIRRELMRGGQVLYLYNRVEQIDLVAGRIATDFPEARVAYAHGQMEHEELEDIWQLLVRGEMDILVCTTIIETGVDLPGANTLIIEDADRMGLAQLHQLRGRVGRSGRQAYAYFTYRKGKHLSEVAEKRLRVIREYAEFGAGFKIALRDLEIRGAGNLLGAEQHGYIESVGYDLYVRLLSEAVVEAQGGTVSPPFECTVDIPTDAHLPTSYIASEPHRMDIYKKISLIGTEEDLSDVLDEMCDRFGEPPPPAMRLLRIAYIRSRGASYRIRRIRHADGCLCFYPEAADLSTLSELFTEFPGLSLRGSGTPAVICRLGAREDAVEVAFAIMKAYTAIAERKEPTV